MVTETTVGRAYNTDGNSAIPTARRHNWREFHVKRAARTPGLGERIQEARLGLSHRRKRLIEQKELAEMMGVSPATISSWESGAKEPRIETLRRLAEVLGVDRDWLTYGSRESDVGAKINAMSDPNAGGDDDADATIAKLKARQAKTPKTKGSGGKSA
jgi:transcriptional regulator with XRE-family HTH domain